MLDFDLFTDNATTDNEGVVKGDGIFDNMMEAVNLHIDAQFTKGSITGVEKSTVYLGALQTVLQTSAKIFLESQIAEDNSEQIKKQIELLEKQILETVSKTALIDSQKLIEDLKQTVVQNQASEIQAKTALLNSQKQTEDLKDDLVSAQTLGFKTDAKQKVLAKMLESWAIYYSVAKSGSPPTALTTPEIDALKDSIISDLN